MNVGRIKPLRQQNFLTTTPSWVTELVGAVGNFVLQDSAKSEFMLAMLFSENSGKLCSKWRIMPKISDASIVFQTKWDLRRRLPLAHTAELGLSVGKLQCGTKLLRALILEFLWFFQQSAKTSSSQIKITATLFPAQIYSRVKKNLFYFKFIYSRVNIL